MDIQTVLLVLFAAIIALGVVLFQYYYKTKLKGKLALLLSFLRFIALFSVFLLLINPKFVKDEYRIVKANLIVLVDNSSSVASYKDTIHSSIRKIVDNDDIIDRFKTKAYGFGAKLTNENLLGNGNDKKYDSLYVQKNTDITAALKGLQEIYSADNTAVLLLTDGNQNLGQDYEYYGKNQKFPIYPIVIGDTTRYDDIAITQVNTNDNPDNQIKETTSTKNSQSETPKKINATIKENQDQNISLNIAGAQKS